MHIPGGLNIKFGILLPGYIHKTLGAQLKTLNKHYPVMKTIRTIILFTLFFPINLFSQIITEENYLKADKMIWETSENDLIVNIEQFN
jgi:hypothetical protein